MQNKADDYRRSIWHENIGRRGWRNMCSLLLILLVFVTQGLKVRSLRCTCAKITVPAINNFQGKYGQITCAECSVDQSNSSLNFAAIGSQKRRHHVANKNPASAGLNLAATHRRGGMTRHYFAATYQIAFRLTMRDCKQWCPMLLMV